MLQHARNSRVRFAGLNIKEKLAIHDAASKSSKIADDATKQKINGSKAECICDMRKQIQDLQKEMKDSKALGGKVDWLSQEGRYH
jgi:hypothetical protein